MISRTASPRAFVLLEVIVSLTILTITVTMSLRSFSQSLMAARQLEVKTQAGFFARQLLEEYEVNPPEPGKREGGFGDDYAAYTFRVEIDLEEPDYDRVSPPREVDKLFQMRMLEIEIFYDDGRLPSFRAAHIHSAIIGFERFDHLAKRQNMSEDGS